MRSSRPAAGLGAAAAGADPLVPGAWGLNLFEGYGTDRGQLVLAHLNEQASEPGYVGVPMAGVQMKLGAEGEILIRVPRAVQRLPQAARSHRGLALPRMGSFAPATTRHERRADGLLKITGRTRGAVQNGQGKYVAPAPIENRLNTRAL